MPYKFDNLDTERTIVKIASICERMKQQPISYKPLLEEALELVREVHVRACLAEDKLKLLEK